jgi:hypothetical protein
VERWGGAGGARWPRGCRRLTGWWFSVGGGGGDVIEVRI